MTDGTKSEARSVLLLCVFLFAVYNSNLRLIRTADSLPVRLLPFSLLVDGNLYLDRWVEPYLPGPNLIHRIYYVYKLNHHWRSAYPILSSMIILPLYVVPCWWLSRQQPPLASNDIVVAAVIDVMEKLSASLIATLSAGFLYLALRKIASPTVSLIAALVYGLASSTWTISSQALWRHGLTELSFAMLLWALLRDPATPRGSLWAGLALAMAAANKPANAILALAFLVYFLRYHRNRLLLFCAPLFVLGSLVLLYNLYFFDHLLGPNPEALLESRLAGPVNVKVDTLGYRLAGLLLSPNRGLVMFMPWTIFAFWGAARIWKEKTFGWGRYLVMGVVAIFLAHVRYWGWWAGWCYGPRYMTDLLPFLAFFLIPVWPRIDARPLLRATFAAAFLASLWVQIVGAYYYPQGLWDGRPVNIDRDRSRIWDWADTQISRSWKAGLAPPVLYDELYLWLSQLRTTRRNSVPRQRGAEKGPQRRGLPGRPA